ESSLAPPEPSLARKVRLAEPTAGSATTTEPVMIRQAADAPPLHTYDTTFTAVQGEANTFVVFYDDPDREGVWEGEVFFKLDIPRDAQFMDEDGSPVATGDTVAIRAVIDPTQFLVRFSPHGSLFNGRKPALLSFYLVYAELHTGDDAVPDIWYQPVEGEPWTPSATSYEWKSNRLKITLDHFSNYAVAW
ncbi:MAG: hypothetical protein OEW56_05210, partial [Gemmatimonadota bacterium]|nr:hypothetical protein [Gemmatimonadota bacterium]